MSSVFLIKSEMAFNRLVLLWTCWFRLLVMLARLIKVRSMFVTRVATLVSVCAIIWLALVNVVFAVESVCKSCVWRLVGNTHSPSEPFGSRKFEVITETFVRIGCAWLRSVSA